MTAAKNIWLKAEAAELNAAGWPVADQYAWEERQTNAPSPESRTLPDYLKPDFDEIDDYIENMLIKSAVFGGLDRTDVYQNMRGLRDQFYKLITAKIGGLLDARSGAEADLSEKNRQLAEQNLRLAEQIRTLCAVQDESEPLTAEICVLKGETARLTAELGRLESERRESEAERLKTIRALENEKQAAIRDLEDEKQKLIQKLEEDRQKLEEDRRKLEEDRRKPEGGLEAGASGKADVPQPTFVLYDSDKKLKEAERILQEARISASEIVESARANAEMEELKLQTAARQRLNGITNETKRLRAENHNLAARIKEYEKKISGIDEHMQAIVDVICESRNAGANPSLVVLKA